MYFNGPGLAGMMTTLVKEISKALHKNDMLLIVTLFLSRDIKNPIQNMELLNELDESVDFFNVMVYDYISHEMHAPIKWGENTMEAFMSDSKVVLPKILFGIPFYGYKFTDKEPVPTMGWDLIDLLQKTEKPLFKWNPVSEEHSIAIREYVGKTYETKMVIFPSLYVIAF